MAGPDNTAEPSGATGPLEPRRGSLLDELLTLEERERLFALRAASSDQAAVYASILTVLAEAKQAYQLQMRTGDIRRRLESSAAAAGVEDLSDRGLRPALDQLREWKCVDWVQDPSFRATSVEEYLKRHELWELTPIGDATLRSIRLVLAATEEPGSLQRAMFRQIRDALDDLAAAVETSDAVRVYLRLRDLDLAIGELASNAREFYATINRIAREDRLEDHVFLLYKDQLIAYLQDFHDDLVRNRSVIARRLVELDDDLRDEIIGLADDGDDSAGLFGAGAGWAQRWHGMLDWFVAGRSARSEADSLIAATTVAIRELLTLLRRLTEQATRPVNRASELRATAAWFARCDTDDEAHQLFDAAFGLASTAHLGFPLDDPDASGKHPSWWDADPVDIRPVRARRRHEREPHGSDGWRTVDEVVAARTRRRRRGRSVSVRLRLVLGLPGPSGSIVESARRHAEPLRVTSRMLRSSDTLGEVSGMVVYVCENPSIVAMAADEVGPASSPLVCTDGMPKSVTGSLLAHLTAGGAELRVHADFDDGGVAIVGHVTGSYGAEPWRFATHDYVEALDRPSLKLTGHVGSTPWDAELSATMNATARAVHEESVVDLLLDDLRVG